MTGISFHKPVNQSDSRKGILERKWIDGMSGWVIVVVGGILVIQTLGLIGIFWVRLVFGGHFDMTVFEDFQTQQSNRAVDEALNRQEVETARAAQVQLRDDVSQTVERANQEMAGVQTRASEQRVVVDEAQKRAMILLSQAEVLYQKGEREAAVNVASRALKEAPSYLPVVRKIAGWHEEQGQSAQARFQWEKALAMTSPLAPEQNEIQNQLSRLSAVDTEVKRVGTTSLPARLRMEPSFNLTPVVIPTKLILMSVQRRDLATNDLYDLRFNLQVTLGSEGSDSSVEIGEVRVDVSFYDQFMGSSGDVMPIRALPFVLRPKESWKMGETRTLAVNYTVPKGYFKRRSTTYGRSYQFCGYLVQVYYRDKLQKSYAEPAEVLEKYMEVP